MFMHNKRLMYTVRVSRPDPALASMMLEQFGGPQGELAAAMRYFTQGLAEEDAGRKDMLIDIATEELSHLEIIGNVICMLGKGARGAMAEGLEPAELMRRITAGGESHTLSLLYGDGAALVNSAGAPWHAGYVDTIGEPTADLRSNIAAEARAKIVYERLINITPDPDVRDALTFLMTREIAHQKSFEKALYSIEGSFPPGKLPGDPRFTDLYMDMSQGEGDMDGPWNSGEGWERVSDRDAQCCLDGGDGSAQVRLDPDDAERLRAAAMRTASDPGSDPTTGAELAMRPGGRADAAPDPAAKPS